MQTYGGHLVRDVVGAHDDHGDIGLPSRIQVDLAHDVGGLGAHNRAALHLDRGVHDVCQAESDHRSGSRVGAGHAIADRGRVAQQEDADDPPRQVVAVDAIG